MCVLAAGYMWNLECWGHITSTPLPHTHTHHDLDHLVFTVVLFLCPPPAPPVERLTGIFGEMLRLLCHRDPYKISLSRGNISLTYGQRPSRRERTGLIGCKEMCEIPWRTSLWLPRPDVLFRTSLVPRCHLNEATASTKGSVGWAPRADAIVSGLSGMM